MYPVEIIQKIIDKYNYQTYLEIGVEHGSTFDIVNVHYKTGVDPDLNSHANVFCTSDEFFQNLPSDYKFDVIFVDGFHEWHQCYRDICNSIKHLSPNGTILVHDVNPWEAEWTTVHETEFRATGLWTGDVYKALIEVRMNHKDMSVCTIEDIFPGLGVIRKGIGVPVYCDLENLDFKTWKENRMYLMNPISANEFIEKLL